LPQFIIRDALCKPLGRGRRLAIELAELRCSAACDPQSFAFPGHLAHQPDLLGFGRIEAAASQNQVANHSISQVTFEPRNSAETWNQAETQLGKTKTCRLVGNNQIAYQRQL